MIRAWHLFVACVARRPIPLPTLFGLVVVCTIGLMWTPNASAATISVVSGNGPIGAPDPNVTVTDSCAGTTTQATIVPPYSDSGGYWIDPISGSQWDSVNAGSHGCNGTYQMTFTLPADAVSPSLTVTELADNSTNVSVNGNQPFITGNVPGQCVHAYDGPPAMGTTASGLVPGINTLTFNVDNCYPAAGVNPTGLDFVATVTYSAGAAPTISSVKPDWGPYNGGTRVTITGTNFGSSPSVEFADNCDNPNRFQNPARVLSASSTRIVASVPAATDVAYPDGAENVGELNGPACLGVFTAPALSGAEASCPNGAVTSGGCRFTYVVPQIGYLAFQGHARGAPTGVFSNCTAEVVHSRNHSVLISAAHCLTNEDLPFRGRSYHWWWYDFAFAPGYFGPLCKVKTGMQGASQYFGCGGTAPYGVWCADSSSHPFRSRGLYFDADPGCGNTPGPVKALTGASTNPDEDFAIGLMAPNHPAPRLKLKAGCPTRASTLEACIGGGLPVAWDAGGNVGSASGQSWNVFGYSGAYLDSCSGTPSPTGGPYGQRAKGLMVMPSSACSWIGGGDSGGAWLNSQNGFPDGIGALNKANPCTWFGVEGLCGTYLGTDARALWNFAQHLPPP